MRSQSLLRISQPQLRWLTSQPTRLRLFWSMNISPCLFTMSSRSRLCSKRRRSNQQHGILKWTICLPILAQIHFLLKREKLSPVLRNYQALSSVSKAPKFSVSQTRPWTQLMCLNLRLSMAFWHRKIFTWRTNLLVSESQSLTGVL